MCIICFQIKWSFLSFSFRNAAKFYVLTKGTVLKFITLGHVQTSQSALCILNVQNEHSSFCSRPLVFMKFGTVEMRSIVIAICYSSVLFMQTRSCPLDLFKLINLNHSPNTTKAMLNL